MNEITLKPTSDHEKLLDNTLEALKVLFGDNTVDASVTRESLHTIREEVNVMLDALEDDEEAEAISDEELLEEDAEDMDMEDEDEED